MAQSLQTLYFEDQQKKAEVVNWRHDQNITEIPKRSAISRRLK